MCTDGHVYVYGMYMGMSMLICMVTFMVVCVRWGGMDRVVVVMMIRVMVMDMSMSIW